MATMDGQNVKSSLEGIYKVFMNDEKMQINESTGIVSDEIAYDTGGKGLRFATMPYIGKYYGCAKPKILFIGLDMGKDIKADENRYLTFEERHKSISKPSQLQKCNPHIAGTYVASLAFLSQYNDKWEPEWKSLSQNKKRTMATLVHKYYKKKSKENVKVEEIDNVLEYIGLTNLFKFVTVGRDKAQGGENRCFINRKLELKLLRDEVELFNPDIIILQSKEISKYKKTIAGFKAKGIKVIEGCHPSYATGGWNKIEKIVDWYLPQIQ